MARHGGILPRRVRLALGRILMIVVIVPLVLVALGLSVVVRCEVQRLRRWPGVTVTLWRWRRTVTGLNKGED